MRRWWPLLALGLVAFVVFALVTLPARVVLSQFESSGVHAAGVSGTAWNGRAEVLIINGIRIGGVEWDLHVAPLFAARLDADVKVTRVDGFMQTELTAAPSGRVTFSDLTGSLAFSGLPPNIIRGGWTGALNLKLTQLVLENGWPVSAEGTVEAIDVTGPASKPVNMGSYKVTFPAEATEAETLNGALADIGGPLQISGTLQLKAADRSYLINGLIAARPDAPRDVVNSLQILGPPDEDGRRPFGLEGTM
ncbi:MAG: type II secretion system protein N [Steroidobacter sp.]